MNPIFIRYRTRWSSGHSDWEYALFPFTKVSEDCLNEIRIQLEYEMPETQLDGYRGMDVEVTTPPKEWIDKEIKRTESQIEFKKQYIELLKNCQ